MDKPELIEPGVKYFLSCTLNNCRQLREKYQNKIFNAAVGIAFIAFLAMLLYYKYKGKLTPEEKEQQTRKQQEYILSKLKMVNATHYAQSKGIPLDCRADVEYGKGAGIGMGMLTNLPAWKGPDEDYYLRHYS
jgi:hypothetical protein